jgi:integrase
MWYQQALEHVFGATALPDVVSGEVSGAVVSGIMWYQARPSATHRRPRQCQAGRHRGVGAQLRAVFAGRPCVARNGAHLHHQRRTLADFLEQQGMPLVVANLSREHIEEFLSDVLQRHSPGTVETRYRGMRRSELAYLAVDDFDLDHNVAHVPWAKCSRERIVPFGRKTAKAVDKYTRLRATHRHAQDRALWPGRQRPLLDSAIDLMLRRRAKQAGLRGVHLHVSRRAFAYGWLSSGGLDGHLMQLAGWRSREILNRYGASAAAERARAAHYGRVSPGDRL